MRVTPELLVIVASKVCRRSPTPHLLRAPHRPFTAMAAVAAGQTRKNVELFNPMIFQKHCR